MSGLFCYKREGKGKREGERKKGNVRSKGTVIRERGKKEGERSGGEWFGCCLLLELSIGKEKGERSEIKK